MTATQQTNFVSAIELALYERDEALTRAEQKQSFTERAMSHMLAALTVVGDMGGEALVDSCIEAGIVPVAGEARAFGPVFMKLARAGLIVKAGYCQRVKGHATSGGVIWRKP